MGGAPWFLVPVDFSMDGPEFPKRYFRIFFFPLGILFPAALLACGRGRIGIFSVGVGIAIYYKCNQKLVKHKRL